MRLLNTTSHTFPQLTGTRKAFKSRYRPSPVLSSQSRKNRRADRSATCSASLLTRCHWDKPEGLHGTICEICVGRIRRASLASKAAEAHAECWCVDCGSSFHSAQHYLHSNPSYPFPTSTTGASKSQRRVIIFLLNSHASPRPLPQIPLQLLPHSRLRCHSPFHCLLRLLLHLFLLFLPLLLSQIEQELQLAFLVLFL